MDIDPDSQPVPGQQPMTPEEYISVQSNNIDRLIDIVNRLIASTATSATPTQTTSVPPSNSAPDGSQTPKKSSGSVSRNIKPANPDPFDGDRRNGRAFWNSVEFYMLICGDDFPTLNSKVVWVLSYMNSGRASIFAQKQSSILEKKLNPFVSWDDFRSTFEDQFFPKSEKEEALNTLASDKYNSRTSHCE